MRVTLHGFSLWMFSLIAVANAYGQPGSNDSLIIQQLLKRIAHLQARGDYYFPAGSFPAYREYDLNKGVLKEDDNIFFTALAVLTLRSLQPHLDEAASRLCDSIFVRTASLYKLYQNKNGRLTYNFWKTKPPQIFPNGGWLNLFDKSQSLPDDLDDTAIVLMAKGEDSSIVNAVHGIMQKYTSNTTKRVRSTLPQYRNLPAYSTWFGVKMPVDFDVCVLSNILYMVHSYNLPYRSADSASLQFIRQVVQNRDYWKSASLVSPHYGRTPVILYHLSRLMAHHQVPELAKFKSQLIQDATQLYYSSNQFLDKILLSTALLRWNIVLPDEVIVLNEDLETFTEQNNFVFFLANMSSILSYPLNKWVGKAGIGKFNYYCPAYNEVLLLENAVLRRARVNGQW